MKTTDKRPYKWVAVSLLGIACTYLAICVAFAQLPFKSTSRHPNTSPAYLAKQAKLHELDRAAYKAWHQEKNLAKAEALFREELALEPGDPMTPHSLAQLLDEEGKSAEALTAYRNMGPSSAQHDPATLAAYARLAEKSGNHAEAAAIREKAAAPLRPLGDDFPPVPKISPTVSATQDEIRAFNHIEAGNDCYRYGNDRNAFDEYAFAYRLAPHLAIVQFYYGKGLEQRGKLNEAHAAYQNAARLSGDSDDAVAKASVRSLNALNAATTN